MKLVTLFLVLFSITHCDVYAQDTKPLKKQLSAAKEDTTRIRLLNNIADIYYNNYEYDSCKEYATQALNLSIRLENNISANKNADYALLCKKLKAKSIENYGSSIIYENSNASVDSVEIAAKYWNETGDKKGIASVYQRLGEVYTNQNNFTNALKYYNLSINLFKGLGNEAAVAFLYYDISLTQRYMANYGDALESGILSLEMFKKTKDTLLIIQCLLANGFTYMLAKDYKEALKTQQAGLNMAIAFKDSEYIATSYSDMGNTHKRSGNLSAALNDYTTAFNIRKKLNSSFYLSSNLLYIADILAKQEKYQESLAKDFESLQYAKQQKDGRYILDVYYSIAENYIAIHDYKNALLYYDTLFQVSTKINDNFRRSLSMQGMANVYLMQNKIQPAIDYLQKALIFTDTDDYRNIVNVYKGLSTAYEKKGDYKNAFESLRQYKRYSDSVEAHEKTLKLTSLTNQLEFQNKRALLKASQDKQLAIQQNQINQQKLLRNITIAGLIIVIVFAFIFFIRFREKRKLNIQLEETVVNLKSTQKQLIQSEKMASLGELTAGIAHEIQNPLNFVINFSGVSNELIDDYKKEQSKPEETRDQELENEILEDIKSNLEKINHHGKRAEAIVKGMLQHSRASASIGVNVKELTDINKLADEYARLSYHGLRAKDKNFNATIATDYDESLPRLNIVPQDIGRVILNLLTNAFYAVSEKKKTADPAYKPTVTLCTKKAEKTAVITVSDNGNGIPPNIMDKIYQPFFTTKPAGQGTGLGLSMSYDIITKSHGGKLTVDSSESRGTTFTIILPLQ